MIRTRMRKRVVSRSNIEDGSSQPRSQFRSSNGQSINLVRNRSQQIQGYNNFCSNTTSSVDSQFQPKTLPAKNSNEDTSSSDSEDNEFFQLISRPRLLNHLSDYETGESSDRTCRQTRAGISKRIQQKHDPTTSRQVVDSDSSSDDSVLSLRIVKNLKRPLSPTSTSDTSDSGVPIASRRSVKRMRVLSTEENSSGSSSDENDQNLRSYVSNQPKVNINNTEKVNPAESQLLRSSTQESEDIPVVVPGARVRSLRGRRIPITESESESDLVSTNHTVRGRRIPVIESEDDSGSPQEHTGRSSRASSLQGVVSSILDIHEIRSRRNVPPPQESESSLAINVPVSSTHNVRRRQVVGSNIVNTVSAGQNVWRVTAQAEETEDNGGPISNRRRVRGRRIPVVESEDDLESGSANNNSSNEISIQDGVNEVVISLGSDVVNLRRSVPSADERNIISNYNVRERNIPLIQREDESHSSDSDIRPRTLSNRMAPIFQSDDSSSTSSSSSTDSDDSIPIRNPRRHSRPIPIVDDYEDIANSLNEFDVNITFSTDAFDDNDGQNGKSSDTDEESEKCPICLAGFKLQEIGKPKSCEHKFCSLCIKEWASKNNTCPVDRKVFDQIVVYDKIEGEIVCELPVEQPNQQDFDEDDLGRIEELVAELFSDSSDESSWYFDDSDGDGPEEMCSVCGTSNQPHRMISCDSCDTVYHLGCVNPPLRNFPTINWYCTQCEYDTDTFSDSD